jgi:hypothetical protein
MMILGVALHSEKSLAPFTEEKLLLAPRELLLMNELFLMKDFMFCSLITY